MAKVQTWVICKELTTDAKKSEIKMWENDKNTDFETWKIKNLSIEKTDDGCCEE